jgi:glycosyltransferase involved in cell wall biosynthesis
MKIALLHYSAPPVVGGVESVIGHHGRLMNAAGHEVRVIAGRGEQTLPAVRFNRLPMADSRHPDILEVKSELDAGRVPKKFTALVSGIKTDLLPLIADIDILIVHNVCSLNKNLVLTAALRESFDPRQPRRLVIWHHDLAWTTPRYQAELHPGYPWDLLKTAWPGAKQVVISAARADDLAGLMQLSRDKITVVPNGIDIPGFLNLSAGTLEYIDQLKLLNANPLILLPVRITTRKNIELAIRIMKPVCAKFPEARLLVTGPLGPHNPANRAYFEKLTSLRDELELRGAVHFLAELTREFIPDRIISDLYRLADALLLPSREEGFGLPILEAGLSGIPVFCTDIPALKELGGDHVYYFSPDAKPDKAADLIIKYFLNSQVFGLRAAVRKGFTWQRVYEDKIAPILAGQDTMSIAS